MNAVFLKILNMSAAASWLIGAVILLRLLLKKSPRWAVCLLWAAAAVRLVCPFSFESRASLIPSAEVIPQTVITGRSFDIQTGIAAIDVPVNDYLGSRYYEGITVPAEHGANVTNVLALVWIAGMVLLLAYGIISYGRLRRRMATAVRLQDGLFQSEHVDSPFVMGLFRPRIYLPFGMADGQMAHVIAHERAHIARRDHWWKPLGWCVLAVHWFNPLVWLGYILFCRDLELACDEQAVKTLDGSGRAEYTEALLRCSLSRRMVTACPLAFGEVGVKARVKSILNYRKPAFWAIVIAALACIAVGICFLTDPVSEGELAMPDSGVLCWFDRIQSQKSDLPVTLDAFPGVTFRYVGGNIYAGVQDPETGKFGDSLLLGGMPIVDAWFWDVTGDGQPELCTTSYWGSGMIDERIQICDYANGQRWLLNHRGTYDYRLRAEEDCLYVERRKYMEETVLDTLKLVSRDGVLMLEDGTEFWRMSAEFTGTVTGYHGNGLLVQPVYGTRGLSADTEYVVFMDENLLAARPRVGDTVVVSYDGTVRETYPPALSDGEIVRVIRQTETDLRPMIFAGGAVYMDTGRSVPAEIDGSAILGTITSAVSGDEYPTEEGQSNFGCEGSRYALFEVGIVVELGGEWFYFEPLTQNDA